MQGMDDARGGGPTGTSSTGMTVEEVVRDFTGPLRAFFYRRSRDWDAVEGLLQETFLRVHRYLGTYRAQHRISSWVFAIATNLYRDFARTRPPSTLPLLEDLLAVGPEGGGHPEAEAEASEVREAVMASVRAMAPRLRSVFMLRHHYGLSNAEIARALSIPEGTVKSRMHAACRHLRDELGRRGLDPWAGPAAVDALPGRGAS